MTSQFLIKMSRLLTGEMLETSNHFALINPAPFLQSTLSSHSVLPLSNQMMDRTKVPPYTLYVTTRKKLSLLSVTLRL